jgi:hypothetical protein
VDAMEARTESRLEPARRRAASAKRARSISCLSADFAAKAAFLHDDDGPDWLTAGGPQGRFADERGARHDTMLGAAA